MAALCANGGERKLFGGTFGGYLQRCNVKISLYINVFLLFVLFLLSHHLYQAITIKSSLCLHHDFFRVTPCVSNFRQHKSTIEHPYLRLAQSC